MPGGRRRRRRRGAKSSSVPGCLGLTMAATMEEEELEFVDELEGVLHLAPEVQQAIEQVRG